MVFCFVSGSTVKTAISVSRDSFRAIEFGGIAKKLWFYESAIPGDFFVGNAISMLNRSVYNSVVVDFDVHGFLDSNDSVFHALLHKSSSAKKGGWD